MRCFSSAVLRSVTLSPTVALRRGWLAGGLGFTVFQDYDAAEHPLGKSSTKTPGPWSMELLAQKYCSHTELTAPYPIHCSLSYRLNPEGGPRPERVHAHIDIARAAA